MYHLGAPFPLGFRLPRNGAYHGLVNANVLDFHIGNLDSPCVSLNIKRFLDIQIEFLPFRQHFVKLVLAQ